MNPKLETIISAQYRAGTAMKQAAADVERIGDASEAAMMKHSRATRHSLAMSRNLMFQWVDIGQALVTAPQMGIYALQNLGFQVAQIGQLYAGNGGLNAAVRDSAKLLTGFATKFAPIALGAAAVSAAFLGMQHEINKSSNTVVSFGDVTKATFKVIGSGLYDAYIAPFAAQLNAAFTAMWEGVVWTTKTFVNSFVVTIGSAGLAVEYLVLTTGAVLKDGVAHIQNFFVSALQALNDLIYGGINAITGGLNELVKFFGADKAADLFGLPSQIPQITSPDLSYMKAGYGGTFSEDLAGINKTYGDAFNNLFTEDHAGNFFGAVKKSAIEIATANKQIETSGAGAGKVIDQLSDKTKTLADVATDAFSGIGSSIAHAFRKGGDVATNVLDAVLSRVLRLADSLLDNAINSLFGNIFGSLFGGIRIPGFANGTNNAPGGLAVVGERGPELVNLPRGSQVIPNNMAFGTDRIAVDVSIGVENGNLIPVMVQVAGEVAGRAIQPVTKQMRALATQGTRG
mgnify:CR=1 FL=1